MLTCVRNDVKCYCLTWSIEYWFLFGTRFAVIHFRSFFNPPVSHLGNLYWCNEKIEYNDQIYQWLCGWRTSYHDGLSLSLILIESSEYTATKWQSEITKNLRYDSFNEFCRTWTGKIQTSVCDVFNSLFIFIDSAQFSYGVRTNQGILY